MTARRKDLSLHRMGLPVHQGVPVDEIFGDDYGGIWHGDSLEEFPESFIPRMARVKMQHRQIERRLKKLRNARTRVGKRYYSRLLKSDLKQSKRSLDDLWAKAARWKVSWFKTRSDKRINKLARETQALHRKHLAYKKRVRAERRRAGVS
jgi:hypothetical protein